VTESGEGQISHHTGPKGDLLLDPQLPVGFGADVAAAGLHLEAEVVKGSLGSGAVVGSHDKDTSTAPGKSPTQGLFLEAEERIFATQ
jgi:hypothetical protein